MIAFQWTPSKLNLSTPALDLLKMPEDSCKRRTGLPAISSTAGLIDAAHALHLVMPNSDMITLNISSYQRVTIAHTLVR